MEVQRFVLRTSRRHVSPHVCAGRPQALACTLRGLLPESLFDWSHQCSRVSRGCRCWERIWINRCSCPRSRQASCHRGNHRDVVSKLSERCDKPPLYSSQIPFWDTDKHERTVQTCYFLLPHEIVDWVLSKAPAKPTACIRGLETQLRAGGPSCCCVRSLGWLSHIPHEGSDVLGTHEHHDEAWARWEALLALQLRQKNGFVHADVHTTRSSLCSGGFFCQLLAGKYSSVRDDGKNFKSSSLVGDAWRSPVAGMNLKAKGGVTQ